MYEAVELLKDNEELERLYTEEMSGDSIGHAIRTTVNKRNFETIRILLESKTIMDDNEESLIVDYIVDADLWVEFYKIYYNLNIEPTRQKLGELMSSFSGILKTRKSLDEYYSGEMSKDDIREYLASQLYSALDLHNLSFIYFQYLVENGAPITDGNIFPQAVKFWGYPILKLVGNLPLKRGRSTRLSLYMLDKKRAVTLVKAIASRYTNHKEETSEMFDYLFENEA